MVGSRPTGGSRRQPRLEAAPRRSKGHREVALVVGKISRSGEARSLAEAHNLRFARFNSGPRSEGRTLREDALTTTPAAATEDAFESLPRLGSPILWHSNSPWAGTGYGTQTALFGPLLQEILGHRIAFSSFYGLHGSQLGWVAPSGNPYHVYPGGRDAYGNDVVGAHARHWFNGENGLVVVLTDPWVLQHAIMSRLPVLAWVPIDHDPIIPKTDQWFWGSGAVPLAMSRFGERVLQEAGHSPLYAPHGFDPTTFYPAEDRRALRESLSLPADAFIVGMVAANKGIPGRKSFAEAIDAVAALKEKHDDVVLYLHTSLEAPDGENILGICDALGIRAMSTDQYSMALGLPPSRVARLMGCFDVLLNPAQGEGFGVPLVEAQACGTPCITSDFSAMPEVAPVAHGNWVVGGQRKWTPFDSWQITPNVEALTAALEEAYAEPTAARLRRRKKVAKWAHAEYQARDVVERYWRPAIAETKERLAWGGKRMGRLTGR